MRLVLAMVMVLVGGCHCEVFDPTRTPERRQQAELDARRMRLVEFRDNRNERQREHAQVLTQLEPFWNWPDDGTLAASVHPDAGVSSRQTGVFERVVTISAPGDERTAFTAAEELDTRGTGRVTVVRPGSTSFSIDVAVVDAPRPSKASGPTTPVFDESALCLRACQERRAQIIDTAKRVAKDEAELGDLLRLQGDKQTLEGMLVLQEKLGKAHAALFHALATVPWAREVDEVSAVEAALSLRMKPGFDPRVCETAVGRVASCSWDEKTRVLTLTPLE